MKSHDLRLDSRSLSFLGIWGSSTEIHWTEWSKREGETFEEKINFNLIKRNKIKLDSNFFKKMLISSFNSRQKDVLCETGLWESWEFLAIYVDSNLFFLHQEFSNSGFTKKWNISFKVILLLFYQRCFKIKWEFPKKIVIFDWCLIFGTTSQKKTPFLSEMSSLKIKWWFPQMVGHD